MTSSSTDADATPEPADHVDREAAADLQDASPADDGPATGGDPVADDVVRAEPDPVEPPD